MNKIRYKLRRWAKPLVRRILAAANAHPGPLTAKERVLELVNKLKPIQPGVELLRLGPKGDGGYLIPDDIADIEACFSPGVDTESGFELDCAHRGIPVFMADASVDGPATSHDLFTFRKQYIGLYTGGQYITLDDWVRSAELKSENSDLLLQMDIEGAEYETLTSVSTSLMQRFRIIVVEFHFLDQIWNKHFYRTASAVFEKILSTHACVHIHPNNYVHVENHSGISIPPLMEFSFYRRDRIVSSDRAAVFPHPLDHDNTTKQPIELPGDWYDG